MIIPVLSLWGLYQWLVQLDQEQNVKEYFTVTQQASQWEDVLQNPELYRLQHPKKYQDLKTRAESEQIQLKLYRPDGVILYSSLDFSSIGQTSVETLYQDLNNLQKSYYSYNLRKPVLVDKQLIGFYELIVPRSAWQREAASRTSFIFVGAGIAFLVLYLLVLWLLHRKWTKPLQHLMVQMKRFAGGLTVERLPKKKKDEIADLEDRFFQMKDQIEEANQKIQRERIEKERMIASLSHDLKTPLTTIQAYMERLMKQHDLSQIEKEEYQQILYQKIDLMKQMLNDLNVYTTLQSSEYRLEQTIVENEEFFEMLFSGYEELCHQADRNLQTYLAVEGTGYFHDKQMIRLMDNLVSNAIRHTSEQGLISLVAVDHPSKLPDFIFSPSLPEWTTIWSEGVLLLVQNEGEAIPSDFQEHVFSPFMLNDPARRSTIEQRSGLGLSIVQLITEKHGGDVRLWSQSPYGTIVGCWFPKKGA